VPAASLPWGPGTGHGPWWEGGAPHLRTVLLVEDDDFGREALAQILEATGYGVARAADGGEALRRLREALLPGLILLGLRRPLLGGWQFCARQQRDPRLAGIPVIVVSAADAAPLRAHFRGIVEHFEKPIAVPDLLEAVRRHCQPR
jgi:CheY-like chemotaxis protein